MSGRKALNCREDAPDAAGRRRRCGCGHRKQGRASAAIWRGADGHGRWRWDSPAAALGALRAGIGVVREMGVCLLRAYLLCQLSGVTAGRLPWRASPAG